MTDGLHIAQNDGWLAITLSRPDRRNALDTRMLTALAAALTGAADDPGVRAVALSGADGHFAAGADISEIAAKTSAEAAVDPRKPAWAAIRAFPKPLVAGVDGFCLGGGCELAMMADVIIAGPTARFGLPETGLGIIPGAGGLQRLEGLIGRARAAWMALGGEIIDAETAAAWGLASVLAEGSGAAAGAVYAEKLARRAPLALAAAKACLVDAAEARAGPELDRARSRFEGLMDSADKQEGIAAFREKRAPAFTGR